jgi:hypothetical protein
VFIYDEFGCPVPCDDARVWTAFVAAQIRAGAIGREVVGRFQVSTYFVGLDQRGRFPWGPEPLIWETWVNEMEGDVPTDRGQQVDYLAHATRWAAAVAHRRIVREIEQGTYKPSGRRWTVEKPHHAPRRTG